MKISFCTSIRNRLHHLKETLQDNLRHAMQHEVEFIILDYGSTDGLRTYLFNHYELELKVGSIKYYEYRDAVNFDRCHARNLAFKMATGELVCNVDADNFIGQGFCEFIEKTFSEESRSYITGIDNPNNLPDCWGKLCLRKEDFLAIGGYDEEFEGHGYEDVDIANRLSMLGLRKVTIENPLFLKAISHDDSQRIKEERLTVSIEKLLMFPANDDESLFLLLLKNQQYLACTVLRDDPAKIANVNACNRFRLATGEGFINVGSWHCSGDNLRICNTSTVTNYHILRMKDRNVYINEGGRYYEVLTSDNYCNIVLSIMQIFNRYRMEHNYHSGKSMLTPAFGNGTLHRSGEVQDAIQL